MQHNTYDVIVIGAGPAGLMAAGTAAGAGGLVLLLEQNPAPGRKLLLSGGGRCNFTNAEFDLHRLTAKYRGGKALLSPFTRFGPEETLAFFAKRGMPYKIEEHLRAFPCSDSSSSVLQVLMQFIHEHGVDLQLNTHVDSLILKNGQAAGVRIGTREVLASSIIIASGGLARPDTGSTGDGFVWLEKSGHTVVRPKPSLVPIVVREPWIAELQGLSFPDVGIQVRQGSRVVDRGSGKLLFTHFGLSGPGILNMASRIAEAAGGEQDACIDINFFPGSDAGELNRRLQQLFADSPRRQLKNLLEEVLPPRLAHRILRMTTCNTQRNPGEITGSEIPKKLRSQLVQLLQHFRLTFQDLQSEDWAVVSSGGIPVDEIDFRCMESKRTSGLYIVGDMIDINRPSGGYSLQICWSTGRSAGTAAVQK